MATLGNDLQLIGATKASEVCKKLVLHYGRPRLRAKQINGLWEIGWGMRYHPNGKLVKLGDKVTKEQADEAFFHAMVRYEKAVLKALKRPLQQHEFDALVSLVMARGTFFITNRDTKQSRSLALIRRINGSKYIDKNIRSTFRLWRDTLVDYKTLNRFGITVSVYSTWLQRCSEYHLFTTGELKLFKLKTADDLQQLKK